MSWNRGTLPSNTAKLQHRSEWPPESEILSSKSSDESSTKNETAPAVIHGWGVVATEDIEEGGLIFCEEVPMVSSFVGRNGLDHDNTPKKGENSDMSDGDFLKGDEDDDDSEHFSEEDSDDSEEGSGQYKLTPRGFQRTSGTKKLKRHEKHLKRHFPHCAHCLQPLTGLDGGEDSSGDGTDGSESDETDVCDDTDDSDSAPGSASDDSVFEAPTTQKTSASTKRHHTPRGKGPRPQALAKKACRGGGRRGEERAGKKEQRKRRKTNGVPKRIRRNIVPARFHCRGCNEACCDRPQCVNAEYGWPKYHAALCGTSKVMDLKAGDVDRNLLTLLEVNHSIKQRANVPRSQRRKLSHEEYLGVLYAQLSEQLRSLQQFRCEQYIEYKEECLECSNEYYLLTARLLAIGGLENRTMYDTQTEAGAGGHNITGDSNNGEKCEADARHLSNAATTRRTINLHSYPLLEDCMKRPPDADYEHLWGIAERAHMDAFYRDHLRKQVEEVAERVGMLLAYGKLKLGEWKLMSVVVTSINDYSNE